MSNVLSTHDDRAAPAPPPTAGSVVQPVTHHADLRRGAVVVQGVKGMGEYRVTAVWAGLLRRVRRRKRQVVASSAPDDVEGAHPIQQPEINGRRRRQSDNDDQN